MKTWVQLNALYTQPKVRLLCLLTGFLLLFTGSVSAAISPDTLISSEIQSQINGKALGLYYPQSVKRFYEINHFDSAWIKSQKETGPTWEAMLMIDCVLQFGLSHADYHPDELLYARLHAILEQPNRVSLNQKARFDIMLTDAMITFINHLHYGKLNPEYAAGKIDAGISGFSAENTLLAGLQQNTLAKVMLNVQPKSKEYADLQNYMHLLKGQYLDDCYEIPEAEVRKVAINMERLRWAAIDEPYYIHINIPSYTLKFYQKDSVYQFKVIVGKAATPTPTLHSAISYFTTAPEWNVPKSIMIKEMLPRALRDIGYLDNNHLAIYDLKGNYVQPSAANLKRVKQDPSNYHMQQSSGCDNSLGVIVFRFANPFDIYLHDTPEKNLFKQNDRAFSHGCIRVEQAEKLASLLLKYDSAADKINVVSHTIAAYQTKTFVLNKPMPIKITYITGEMRNGVFTTYKDIYNLDKSLEMALYNIDLTYTMRIEK